MPPMPTTDYAREGSLLHAAIAAVIEENLEPNAMIGFEHDGMVLDQDLYDRKLLPAVEAFDDLLDKLEEEAAELRAELPGADPARLADEVGDLLFVLANLARKLALDPEEYLPKRPCICLRKRGTWNWSSSSQRRANRPDG